MRILCIEWSTVKTVSKEHELDALPKGTRLRFTVSGATLYKTFGDLWVVDGISGVQMPADLCLNGTPMEILELGKG